METTEQKISALRTQASELLERANQREASIMELANGKAALLREKGDAAYFKVRSSSAQKAARLQNTAEAASKWDRKELLRERAADVEGGGEIEAEEKREAWHLKAEHVLKHAALNVKARTESLRQRAARLIAQAERFEKGAQQ